MINLFGININSRAGLIIDPHRHEENNFYFDLDFEIGFFTPDP